MIETELQRRGVGQRAGDRPVARQAERHAQTENGNKDAGGNRKLQVDHRIRPRRSGKQLGRRDHRRIADDAERHDREHFAGQIGVMQPARRRDHDVGETGIRGRVGRMNGTDHREQRQFE
ncbi:MAG TPA: hypothetical protein VL048_01210 [Xanthobacteraceae bacterium]|nr:hypothetical protein [Xanthobacteraceae bacterium]